MSTAAAANTLIPIKPGARFPTFAEVVEELGDVPIHRILWDPYPGRATEADVLRYCGKKILTERVDGILVVKAIERDTLRRLLDQYFPETRTLADVVEQLGDVPLHRILWHPRSYPATEEDVLRFVDGDEKRLVERVDGILVEKPMGNQEALLAMWIGTCLNNFVVPRKLGVIGAPDAIMRFQKGQNRMPDVYFKAWATLPSKDAHRKSIAEYAPDLAVEVLSESNRRKEIDRKKREYFEGGAKLVWIVDPKREIVEVFTEPEVPTVLTTADTLRGEPVLPGFTLLVADIFSYLDPPES